jgi:hypothetical protein
MDDISEWITDRETALANFDHARDDFVRTFAQVSEKALTYKPDGDDYSIGDLLPHVLNQINTYAVVLEMMTRSDWGPTRPFEGESRQVMQDYSTQIQALFAGGEGRNPVVAELEQVHDRFATAVRDMAHKDYAQKASVVYLSSPEPYPTSVGDLLEWLTNHYNEHIAQVWQMLERWEREK